MKRRVLINGPPCFFGVEEAPAWVALACSPGARHRRLLIAISRAERTVGKQTDRQMLLARSKGAQLDGRPLTRATCQMVRADRKRGHPVMNQQTQQQLDSVSSVHWGTVSIWGCLLNGGPKLTVSYSTRAAPENGHTELVAQTASNEPTVDKPGSLSQVKMMCQLGRRRNQPTGDCGVCVCIY